MDKWIKLAHPVFSENIGEEIRKVIQSGNLVQGEKVKEFEDYIAQYLCVNDALAVSSGTAALHLSLIALEIGNGDEVILPAYTFLATANVIKMVGAIPVFVDIGSDFCIDASLIEEKITNRTKAIMVVHEFGLCADMEEIIEIAIRYRLKVIEDAACALGSEYKGMKAGTMGHVGCYSFHPRKLITTGEGGMIVSGDRNLMEKIKTLRNHGINNGFQYPGLNYRMTEIGAVLGLDQITAIDKMIKTRTEQARHYDKALGLSSVYLDKTHTYQTYCMVTNKENFINEMKTHGIEVGRASWGVYETDYYKSNYDCPVAKYMDKNAYSLPMGMHLSLKEIDYIYQKVKLFK